MCLQTGGLCYLYPKHKLSELTEGHCFPTRTAFRRKDRELSSLRKLSPIPPLTIFLKIIIN